MSGRILVLGAAGRLGRTAAESFRDAGWDVRSLVRPRAGKLAPKGTEAVEAHALNEDAVIAAAQGADIVLNALNAPFADWPSLLPQFTQTAVAAAKSAGATLIVPGNLYNYGEPLPEVIAPSTQMQPTSRKGALRLALEEWMRGASDHGVRVVVMRAGDFFGGPGGASYFDRVVLRYLDLGRVVYPGPLEAVHPWAYLPDFARAIVAVAQARERLAPFEAMNFPGHAVTGTQMVHALGRATDKVLRTETVSWWLLRLLSPVVPTFRELSEVGYLWRQSYRVVDPRCDELTATCRQTPFETAVAAALKALDIKTVV